jgi:hypothetical protein
MRSPVLVVAFVASLFWAAPALGAGYIVTSVNDSNDPQACQAIQPDLYQCDTLRRAVIEANLTTNTDTDVISLGSGTYTLTAGELQLSQNVAIAGTGARSTIVQAATEERVFELTGTTSAQLSNLTIQGGTPTSGDGGNILTGLGTTLGLVLARVTDGHAGNGAGIANAGNLSIQNSLIDHNVAGSVGGGIYNNGFGGAASVSVIASTIAFNTANELGGGIGSSGNSGNSVQLLASTIARNALSGVGLNGTQDATAYGSIISGNGSVNCQGTFSSGQMNVESTSGCLPPGDGNLSNVDPLLDSALSNQGGQTDVLTIPASSPAVDHVNPCLIPIDQRAWARFASSDQPCDAGAYEQSATGPPDSGPEPTPTPTPAPPAPTPVPTAVATPTPEPTAVTNKSVVAEEVKGQVLVRDPKSKKFVPLDEATIGNGSEVDARKGTVEIRTSTAGEVARFFDGIFKIAQTKKITTVTLSEALDCKKAKSTARAAAKKPKTRKLWGDGKGKFRTKGSYSAATVRGTKWLVTDTCTTTTTKVTEGVVDVDDFSTHKTIAVRKGKHYTAKARNR